MDDLHLASRYKVIAQDCDNRVLIKIPYQNLLCLMKAGDILENPIFLGGFSPRDAALIGYIAGSVSTTTHPPSDVNY